MTKCKKMKTSIRHKTLLGVASCVIIVVILLTVLIISLEKSSGSTTSSIDTKVDDEDDILIYIGGMKYLKEIPSKKEVLSSVELKSINSNKTCNISSLDYQLYGHASVVTPIGVITCGGRISGYRETNKCVRLTDKNTWEPFPSMKARRYKFDMVVVGDILVAFGIDTFEKINWTNGEKWELVMIDGWWMNRAFYLPCIAKWDDENILIIGGRRTWNSAATNETWILNIVTNTMKRGPILNNARLWHGCARANDNSIIVVGGFNSDDGYLKSTEVLKIGDLEWTNGPDLKTELVLTKIVKSNGRDFIAYSIAGLIVGQNCSDDIYGLRSDRNEWELIDIMNTPHCLGSALNVPLDLIPWCEI